MPVGNFIKNIQIGNEQVRGRDNWTIINTDMRNVISDIPEINLLITDVPNLPADMPYAQIEYGLNKYKPKKAIICSKQKLDLDYDAIQFSHEDYGKYPIYFTCSNIYLHTDENDLVFDPFCGYSTTGICALDMGRRYLGIEINPDIYNVSLKRLEEWQ